MGEVVLTTLSPDGRRIASLNICMQHNKYQRYLVSACHILESFMPLESCLSMSNDVVSLNPGGLVLALPAGVSRCSHHHGVIYTQGLVLANLSTPWDTVSINGLGRGQNGSSHPL